MVRTSSRESSGRVEATRKVRLLLSKYRYQWRRLYGQRQDVCVCGLADRIFHTAA